MGLGRGRPSRTRPHDGAGVLGFGAGSAPGGELAPARRGGARGFRLGGGVRGLDRGRGDGVVGAIPEGAQALLTAAFEGSIPEGLLERADIVRVKDGALG